ncbi:MAG: hypothetical protein OXI91_05700 [Chloroflexota bacterium]|nr:hypothetical protein [Chloroflexota bacterium]
MGLPYISTFNVNMPGIPTCAERIGRLRSFLQTELSRDGGAAVASSDIEIESDCAGEFGYALIACGRPHPRSPQQLLQLEVRIFDDGSGSAGVNVRSRFITPDGEDPPELRAGPPRFLTALADEFDCSVEAAGWSAQPQVISEDSVEAFVAEELLGGERKLPLLVISEDGEGGVLLDPERARRELMGLARVVRLAHNAEGRYRELVHHTLACYGGAARWIWPGATSGSNGPGPRRPYYGQEIMPEADTANAFYYGLQQKALEYQDRFVPPHEFDSRFSKCRTEVLLARNRQMESREGGQAAPDSNEATRQRRVEQARASLLATEKSRNERLSSELAAAQQRIDELEAELGAEPLDTPPDNSSGSTREVARLQKALESRNATIEGLREEVANLRRLARQGQEGQSLPLPESLAAQLTICNHALNLYRNPMRDFIVKQLRRKQPHDLATCLEACVKDFNIHSRYDPNDPGSYFDIGDFENLVQSYYDCFSVDTPDPRKLRDIRHFRNRVVHPPFGGLNAGVVLDGLRNIAEVLSSIGERQAASRVSGLEPLIEVE